MKYEYQKCFASQTNFTKTTLNQQFWKSACLNIVVQYCKKEWILNVNKYCDSIRLVIETKIKIESSAFVQDKLFFCGIME